MLVTTDIDEQKLVSAAECGVAGMIRRAEATPEHLVQVIGKVTKSTGHLPSDLVGRLVAEGYDTADIAAKLSYSERTTKNVLHEVTTRLQLRNRSHAAAYAMRRGLI